MISSPPVRTEFQKAQGWVPSLPWLKWFQSVTAALQISFGNITGIGNGSKVMMQAPARASGSGPADPSTAVLWVQVKVGSETFWVPAFK